MEFLKINHQLMIIITFISFICFIIHSSINFNIFLDKTYTITYKNIPQNLKLPNILICNNLPYTVAGISYNNNYKEISTLNHKTILKYINILMNTSSIQDIPIMLSETEKNSSEYIINKSLKFNENGSKKQNLSILFYTSCQDIINSCTINGFIHSSYNCCQRIIMNIGTLNGICFIFNSSTLQINNNLRTNQNIGIIFQISRNSFIFNGINNHPGLSISLIDADSSKNTYQFQNSESYQLKDKKGLKLFLKKKQSIDQLRHSCRFSYISIEDIDTKWKSPFECLLEAGIKDCNCHPLISEYLIEDNSLLYKLITNTSICLVNQLRDCFYQYLYYSYNQKFYNNEIIDEIFEKKSIPKCLRKYPPPCYFNSYSSKRQYYHLTADYNSTKDFIAELQISYESLVTYKKIYSSKYELFYFISSLIYNFTFWFHFPIWAFILIYLCSYKTDKTYTTIETIGKSKIKPTQSVANVNLINYEKNKTVTESIESLNNNHNIFVPKKIT
uniref:Recep_L_domain domain-containing protein n=1 Tax=Strongyloides stercoralis TaxID=6248 RepID=A0A0K0DXJ3_STRER